MQNDELQRSRAEIEELHQKYYDLYNLAPAGYITLDMNSRFTEINLVGAELLGFNKDEEYKYTFDLFITPEYKNTFNSHIKKALNTGNKQNFEVDLKRIDKTIFHALIEMSLEFKEGAQYNLVIIDITERKKPKKILNAPMRNYNNSHI